MRNTKLLLLSIIASTNSFAQDSVWVKKVINPILTMNIPAKFRYVETSFVKGYGGEINKTLFGFQYYDTVMMNIKSEEQFQLSLSGFMEGRMNDPTIKKYKLTVFDTSFGGTKGIMTKFKTIDTSLFYKQRYYYVTMVNSKFYWFYINTPSLEENNEEINSYFKSIMFNSKEVNENSFVKSAVHRLVKDNIRQ